MTEHIRTAQSGHMPASVISISQQLDYFKEYKERLTKAKGQAVADEIIAEALYIFSIGTNDFFVNYYVMPLRPAQYTPTEYATYLVGLAEDAVRQAYELGARKVMLSGIPPFGCVPAARTMNWEAPGECNEEYNRVALRYNAGIRDAVGRLGAELTGARVVYLDVYDVPSAIFANPSAYGFENVAQGCCGTGLIETTVLCGMDEAFTCQDADKCHPHEQRFAGDKQGQLCILASQLPRCGCASWRLNSQSDVSEQKAEESVEEPLLPEVKEERTRRSQFVQGLVLSLMFDDIL
ncbi:hypothetical protein D1007_33799 [Hordeum vulgare]|nr:hypothetical protein D1007_33799 [Hordeum vulgare]